MAAASMNALAAPTSLWTMDTEDEISSFGDDNTGSSFTLDKAHVTQGAAACTVSPSGDAAETKMALDLEGANLENWIEKDTLYLNVFLPAGKGPKPNKFFLGMANVTGDWAWVDGIFSSTEVKDGWNKVVYPLSAPMTDINEDGRYKLYFSFFAQNADGSKPPLTDIFVVDGISVDKTK
jgi:hypothetical protein